MYDWKIQGNCVNDWETFDIELDSKPSKEQTDKALSLCRACPVLRECSEYAQKHQTSGVIQGGKVWL